MQEIDREKAYKLITATSSDDVEAGFNHLVDYIRSVWWSKINTVPVSEMGYFIGGCKALDDLKTLYSTCKNQISKGL